jgi:hypothetical protein
MSIYNDLNNKIDRIEIKLDKAILENKVKNKKKFLNYKQASEYLGISVDGLKSRIRRGQMFKIANNNRPLIAFSEIERFLKLQNPSVIKNGLS